MFTPNIDFSRLNACDILYTAYLNEVEASINYQTVANILEEDYDGKAAIIFSEMADVEHGHAKSLAKRLRSCRTTIPVSLYEPVFRTPEVEPHHEDYRDVRNIRPGISVEEVTRILEDAEHETEDFYLSAARKVDDGELKDVLFGLAAQEAKHSRLVPKIVHHALHRARH